MARNNSRSFERAFAGAWSLPGRPGVQRTVSSHVIGSVHLASGAVVVADPLAGENIAPLESFLPIGRAKVAVAMLESPGDMRVACAKIFANDTKVAHWERAKIGTRNGKSKAYSLGVDSGTACFADASVWGQVVSDPSLVEKSRSARAWGMGESFYIGPSSDSSGLVGFSAGMGDGNYTVWVGRNDSNVAVAIAIDFEILNEEKWNSHSFAVSSPGEVQMPQFAKLGLQLEILSRWRSKPYDATHALAIKFSVPFGTTFPEFELVDERDHLIATKKTEINPNESERSGRLVLLESLAPLPEGRLLRVSVKTSERLITLGP